MKFNKEVGSEITIYTEAHVNKVLGGFEIQVKPTGIRLNGTSTEITEDEDVKEVVNTILTAWGEYKAKKK